jgi:hypothetical protein
LRSSQLPLEKYDTDKITNHYVERYDPILEPWLEKKVALLELGVYKGGSLLLWRDYFPLGTIVGIDIHLPKDFKPVERVRLYEGSQADTNFLSKVANETAPEGFDIIIDDASHMGELTKIAFWHLFDHHLKPGGLYVIEDWGTGYWEDWPDGKSLDPESASQPHPRRNFLSSIMNRKPDTKTPMQCHSYGMVGFVKQLVDEQGAISVSRRTSTGEATRRPKFESLTITPPMVIVKKAKY